MDFVTALYIGLLGFVNGWLVCDQYQKNKRKQSEDTSGGQETHVIGFQVYQDDRYEYRDIDE